MPDTTFFQRKGGDLEFLRNREKDGDLVTAISGLISATGVAVSFVPASGKTFYLLAARIVRVAGIDLTGNVEWNCQAEVRFDTAIKDYMGWSGSTEEGAGEGPGAGWGGDSHSIVVGKSLIGDAVKAVDINVIAWVSTPQRGRATIIGWLEDT